MNSVFDHVELKLKEFDAKEILLVMDIDNTLLTSNQDLNSYAWSNWQRDLIKKHSKEAITQDINEFYDIQSVLYSLGKMHHPEAIISPRLQKLQLQGVSTIALTSRGPSSRNATERELIANNIDFKTMEFIGFPEQFIPTYGSGRKVSFQNGIYMTTGQHKGLMLKGLLERLNKTYKVIIFVDDTAKHTINVYNTYKHLQNNIVAFRYGRMDDKVSKFINGDKSLVKNQMIELNNVLNNIFK